MSTGTTAEKASSGSRRSSAPPMTTQQKDGTLGGPVAKNLSEAEQAGLMQLVGAQPGDCAFCGLTGANRGPKSPSTSGAIAMTSRPMPLTAV